MCFVVKLECSFRIFAVYWCYSIAHLYMYMRHDSKCSFTSMLAHVLHTTTFHCIFEVQWMGRVTCLHSTQFVLKATLYVYICTEGFTLQCFSFPVLVIIINIHQWRVLLEPFASIHRCLRLSGTDYCTPKVVENTPVLCTKKGQLLILRRRRYT